MVGQLGFEGCRQGGRQGLAGGEQDGCRQGIVFRLGQQVGGHLVSPGAVVGDHQHLAGAGEGIDRHPAVHRLFGQGHVEVARACDHIHPRDRGGAVGQGSDRLGAADAVDLVNAGQVGSR